MLPLAPSGSEWERLLRHLDLAEDFTLLFLICPSAQHAEAARESCAVYLQSEGRTLEIVPPFSAKDLPGLANRLLIAKEEPPGNVLWVSLYSDSEAVEQWNEALGRALAGLNQTRNLFAQFQGRPVILAGTHVLFEICPHIAPDLWSIRRSVIRLPADQGSTMSQSLISPKSEPLEAPAASVADAERALQAAAKVRNRPGAEADLLRYLIRAAQALEGHGYVEQLNQVLDEAATIAQRKDLPASPQEQATLFNDLAQVLANINRLAEAEQLMRCALTNYEKSYGPDHPNVAIGLNNLALLLQDTNRLAEAEPLMRRTLAIDEKSYGQDHPKVAIRLNNLAILLKDTNRLAEAEPLMRRALEIDEKSYGQNHPTVAIRLNNLAQLLNDTNRLAEAEPLMRRSLAIDERSYGPNHPIVARDLNNLALLLKNTHRITEAEPLMRRALDIDEKSYGPNHPLVAIRLNNLALLLQNTNRIAEAEPLLRRALTIDEKSYGPNHPNVARGLNNLGLLLQDTNRLAEAEPLMRRGLTILQSFKLNTGHEHPHWKTGRNNYRMLLQEMGWPEEKIAESLQWLE
jgi:tetratricopeptide (TPR) repeat protein